MYMAGLGIDRRAVPMSLTRKETGSYVSGGDWVQSDGDPINIKATVQPVSGRTLMDMPEGIREEARWAIWSRSELLLEDVVLYKARRYRVMFVWPRDDGVYYKAAMGLLA